MRQIKLTESNISSCRCTFYNNGKANVMIIDDVFTKPEYRGQGYGKKLILNAIKLAVELDIDSVELTVNKSNIVAKELYEGIGFEDANKDYYRIILNRK